MKRIRYIFPETENFREQRPTLCWEHMYGWMEGYGMLFDPVVFSRTGIIPEWENGWDGKTEAGDFIIAPCAQASELFENPGIPGIYIRPILERGVIARSRKSEKEKIATPDGTLFYPLNLPYDQYEGGDDAWMLGENPAVKKVGESVAVCFEMFAMFGMFREELREEAFLQGANALAGLLGKCGVLPSPPDLYPCDLRIDCQAYGLNRLLIQWFLKIKGVSGDAVGIADSFFLQAIACLQASQEKEARGHLRQAFVHLASLRKSQSDLELYFLEYPHLGILFEDKGFFELEWPHYTRETFLSLFEEVEKHGYRLSIEAGALCWKNLVARYPGLGKRIAKLWGEGSIELTNGTASLPYALMSTLALQYWQFKIGKATFQEVFGKAPSVYQCQENSMTAQMPELLKHFGYQRALHMIQNHGEAPSESTDFIRWASPAGHSLPAMAARHPALAKKGNNFFLDLPLLHAEFGGKEKSLNYTNFQDVGFIPFRLQMIRAHHYTPVWGRFELDQARFAHAPDNAPTKSYMADDYRFSESFFYPDETNLNPISQYEAIHSLSARIRQLRIAASSSGHRAEANQILDQCFHSLCSLEAHDVTYVQGQRRGEFYTFNNCHTNEVPPYSRETLAQKGAGLASGTAAALDKVGQLLRSGQSSGKLFNAAEVPLAFGRIQSPESYSGPNAARRGNALYATGPFPAFSSCEPAIAGQREKSLKLPFESGRWRIELDSQERLVIAFKGQKLSCIPIDRKNGPLSLLMSEIAREAGLIFVRLHYQHVETHVQTVLLDLVFSEQGDYAEINVKYSPRPDFQIIGKWSDFLALEIQGDSALENVWRFNPNVRALTREDRTVSPYYIGAELSDGSCFSLMNEGASLYEMDREKGAIRWLFHVFGESVFHRRMGIVFGISDAFQISRAWSQGLLVGEPKIIPLLEKTNWQGISVEDFVAPDTLLVSNLADGSRELEIPKNHYSRAENMLGENLAGNLHLQFQPMELGLIHL